MSAFLAVAAGAVIGAWLRWGFSTWLNPLAPSLPLGTLAVNVAGGYLVGLAVAYFSSNPSLPPEWRLACITGFLGALTTFSTFSAETVTLMLRQQYAWMLAIVSVHVIGTLAMTLAGMALVRTIATTR